MTTATRRGTSRLSVGVLAFLLVALPATVRALTLDDRGEMRLGMRAYTAVRIGTEFMGGRTDSVSESDTTSAPLSFPNSPAGHVRQHRYFLELKFDHDVRRLATQGNGAGWLLGWLDPQVLKYSLQYRGEGEGIYDYGPSEFSDPFDTQKRARVDLPTVTVPPSPLAPKGLHTSPIPPDAYVMERDRRLRKVARQRHRFFLGYLDVGKGPVEIRVGRQILAWGETDIFRLLDNINPLDNGFGGFLVALDERRVPVDALKASYQFGSVGPVSDAFLEAFGALGNRASTVPGIPPGSPWEPGGLGYPNPALNPVYIQPRADQFRGGARLVFNAADTTFTLAHYYSYLDNPTVVFHIPKGAPFFPNSIQALQEVPRVQISGGSLTFPLPSWYTVVRSEAAYFRDEPFNRQGSGSSADAACPKPTKANPQGKSLPGLGCENGGGYRRLQQANNLEGGVDPFVMPGFFDPLRLSGNTPYAITARPLKRPTFNYALGFDVNRFIRWINQGQTIFFSTQFFYKHVFDSPGDLVLPVPVYDRSVAGNLVLVGRNDTVLPLLKPGSMPGCGPVVNGKHARSCRLEPRFIKLHDDQFLQTLLITTSYRGGRVVPSYAMFYDWQGAIVFQPGVALVRDPFRFVFDYTRIESNIGAGQISALRDRDNVRFQVEYVF